MEQSFHPPGGSRACRTPVFTLSRGWLCDHVSSHEGWAARTAASTGGPWSLHGHRRDLWEGASISGQRSFGFSRRAIAKDSRRIQLGGRSMGGFFESLSFHGGGTERRGGIAESDVEKSAFNFGKMGEPAGCDSGREGLAQFHGNPHRDGEIPFGSAALCSRERGASSVGVGAESV